MLHGYPNAVGHSNHMRRKQPCNEDSASPPKTIITHMPADQATSTRINPPSYINPTMNYVCVCLCQPPLLKLNTFGPPWTIPTMPRTSLAPPPPSEETLPTEKF